MKVDLDSGLLSPVKFVPSPNQDARTETEEVSLLVIHNISLPPGNFQGQDVQDFFLNELDFSKHIYYEKIRSFKVSSHLFIRRDGEVLQFVSFHQRAWHAGASSFEGRTGCNDFSIGIELEGADDIPFSDAQYKQLIECTRAIMAAFPKISVNRIVGHSDISPGRKTDPGALFNWSYYRSQIELDM